MLNSTKVFEIDDLRNKIFEFLPIRCKSCRSKMSKDNVDSRIHLYNDQQWRCSENKYCRGYCNWCCIYVFNHQR